MKSKRYFDFGKLVARLLAVRVVRDERVAEMHLGLLVVLDEQVGLADGVVRRGKLLPVDGDELLDVVLLLRRGGAVEQVLLGHGQHAAGAAGGVVDGDMPVGDGNLQQLDHEPDDFARGEVFSGLLAALFREAPEQLLVDVAHLQRRELVRAKLQFLVLVQDRGEPVVLHHLADGGAVVEVLDDVVNVLREAVDVGAEVLLQERMVFLIDLAERPVGLVRERDCCGFSSRSLTSLASSFSVSLGRFASTSARFVLAPVDQHALQPADDDDGQDDALVFVGLELAAQPLGGFPDVAGEVVELGFVEGKRHRSAFPLNWSSIWSAFLEP